MPVSGSEDAMALIRAVQDPEFSQKLESLNEKQRELEATVEENERLLQEVVAERKKIEELRSSNLALQKEAEQLAGQAKAMRDAQDVRADELEKRLSAVEEKEKDLGVLATELSRLERTVRERDVASQETALKNKAKQDDLSRRLELVRQAGAGL